MHYLPCPPAGKPTVSVPAPDLTPLSGPDLHAQSFPNGAVNPAKEDGGGKKKGRKENLIFMLNWEVTVGHYHRWIWIKALKRNQI